MQMKMNQNYDAMIDLIKFLTSIVFHLINPIINGNGNIGYLLINQGANFSGNIPPVINFTAGQVVFFTNVLC